MHMQHNYQQLHMVYLAHTAQTTFDENHIAEEFSNRAYKGQSTDCSSSANLSALSCSSRNPCYAHPPCQKLFPKDIECMKHPQTV